MKLNLVDKQNKSIGEIEVSDDVFLEEPNKHLVHELLLMQQTRPVRLASCKTRAEVRGGGAKPWKQKGTGRARAGSLRSPLFRGGGVSFGPKFKINVTKMPKRSRLKALCSAITLQKDQLFVLDEFPGFKQPKTKDAEAFLGKFNNEGKKVLIILDQEAQEGLFKSVGNIEKCRAIHWQNLNVFDLFNSDITLVDQQSLKKIEDWLSNWKLRKGSKDLGPVVEAPKPAKKAAPKKAAVTTEKVPKKAPAKKVPSKKKEAGE
ncbi:MAG: 50S ribosomal protein L4 [Candidatus Caenarcaniphilales bacterium]|nr:50S ribosomal protein L4 [Candidatus Caenarcaniphilales bacterium]